MTKKVLFILTSHPELEGTGKKTGWYLPELVYPYNALASKYELTLASPLGGKAPMDPESAEKYRQDRECLSFMSNSKVLHDLNHTVRIDQINPDEFDAIVIPGGHGPAFDLPQNDHVQRILACMYEKGGILGAICHGPAAFVNVKLSNGQSLVQGKKMTSISNEEEERSGLANRMPFLVESRILELGGRFQKADTPGGEKVVVDGRIVTGQNPASAQAFGQAIRRLLEEKEQ